jgi:four helix bundle protein
MLRCLVRIEYGTSRKFGILAFQYFRFSAFSPMRLSAELRDRTKRYASKVIRFYISLPKQREEVRVLGHQLLRSGTSVASHAREASRARSDSEFCSKLDVLLQEADESSLWIELLEEDCGISGPEIAWLLKETHELPAIFVTIVSKTRRRE